MKRSVCVCVGGNYIFKNSEELKELVVVISGEGKEGLWRGVGRGRIAAFVICFMVLLTFKILYVFFFVSKMEQIVGFPPLPFWIGPLYGKHKLNVLVKQKWALMLPFPHSPPHSIPSSPHCPTSTLRCNWVARKSIPKEIAGGSAILFSGRYSMLPAGEERRWTPGSSYVGSSPGTL